MSLFDEKRDLNDRRKRNDGPPPGTHERRSKKDRRQTAISEISLHEWARYFLKFEKHAAMKAAKQQAVKNMKADTSQGVKPPISSHPKRAANHRPEKEKE
jgi:hypothetical protein